MNRSPSTSRLIVPLVLLGLVCILCFSAVFADRVFAFRDAGHYYYPLQKHVQAQWDAGRVPLWNGYENLGVPLAGDPTAAVFYPLKLVFFLPISYARCFNLYVLIHLLLAGGTMYRLARRRLGVGRPAALIAAISYLAAGPVLMQVHNVVYLVGAAWLPLALGAIAGLVERPSLRGVFTAAVPISLMVLGGDPQMAYNVGLVGGLYILLLWRDQKKVSGTFSAKTGTGTSPQTVTGEADSPTVGASPRFRQAGGRIGYLAAAGLVAVILSAIIVLPGLKLAGESNRRVTRDLDFHLARLDPTKHEQHTYQFSTSPWRAVELLWPNFYGRQFPQHRRWIDALPAEGRVWTPTLYQGAAVIIFAALAFSLRRRRRRAKSDTGDDTTTTRDVPVIDRWFSWIAVLAFVASVGWYGLGWLLSELHINPGVGSPFGGLYWLMTIVLPGYAKFRYPSKLLVLMAVAIAALAGCGWDRIETAERRAREKPGRGREASPATERRRRVFLIVALVSLAATMLAWILFPYLASLYSYIVIHVAGRTPSDIPQFGPLAARAAAFDTILGTLQAAVVLGAIWWWLGRNRRWSEVMSLAVVALVAGDLIVANRWIVATAPAGTWETPSVLEQAIGLPESRESSPPIRIYRTDQWIRLPEWETESSNRRMIDAARWDRATLFPKHNLLVDLAAVDVHGAMRSQRFNEYCCQYWSVEGWDRLCVEASILPAGYETPGWERVPIPGTPDPIVDRRVSDYVALWRNPNPSPRVWVEELGSARTWQPVDGAPARIVKWSPTEVTVDVNSPRAGRLILSDQFDTDWKASVDGRPTPITPAYEALRAVAIDAGKHEVEFRYRPMSLALGAGISVVGWLAVLGWFGFANFRKPKQASPRPTAQ